MRTDDMIEDELAPLDELMSDIDSIRDRVGREMTVPELCDYLRDLYRISTKIMAVYKALETTVPQNERNIITYDILEGLNKLHYAEGKALSELKDRR